MSEFETKLLEHLKEIKWELEDIKNSLRNNLGR